MQSHTYPNQCKVPVDCPKPAALIRSLIKIIMRMQGLDAEALAALMASVTLHSSTAQMPDQTSPSQQQVDSEHAGFSISQANSSQQEETSSAAVQSNVLTANAGQGILGDCPLPFAEADSVTATLARGRRPARRAAVNMASPEEAAKVSS